MSRAETASTASYIISSLLSSHCIKKYRSALCSTYAYVSSKCILCYCVSSTCTIPLYTLITICHLDFKGSAPTLVSIVRSDQEGTPAAMPIDLPLNSLFLSLAS